MQILKWMLILLSTKKGDLFIKVEFFINFHFLYNNQQHIFYSIVIFYQFIFQLLHYAEVGVAKFKHSFWYVIVFVSKKSGKKYQNTYILQLNTTKSLHLIALAIRAKSPNKDCKNFKKRFIQTWFYFTRIFSWKKKKIISMKIFSEEAKITWR